MELRGKAEQGSCSLSIPDWLLLAESDTTLEFFRRIRGWDERLREMPDTRSAADLPRQRYGLGTAKGEGKWLRT